MRRIAVRQNRIKIHLVELMRKTCKTCRFAVTEEHRVKIKEKEMIYKYLDRARELNKGMEQESGSDSSCNWYTWNNFPKAF